MRRVLKTLALVALLGVSLHAAAEQGLQKHYYVGEGDVDLFSGRFAYANADISIGNEAQGSALTFTRYYGVHELGSFEPFGHRTGHNFEISLYRYRYIEGPNPPSNPSWTFHVVIGRTEQQIDYSNVTNSGLENNPQRRTTLISSNGANGPYVFTMQDGTRIEFPAYNNSLCPNIGYVTNVCMQASAVIKPNGDRLDFTYETLPSTRKRLRTVVSNRGYAIGIDYNNNPTGVQSASKVCVVNLAVQYMAPSGPCPTGARAATYAYHPSTVVNTVNAGLQSYTSPNNDATSYSYVFNGTYNDFYWMAAVRNPGSSVDNLTLGYSSPSGRVASQTYADGSTWSYAYQHLYDPGYENPYNEWTDVSNPLAQTTRHHFGGSLSARPFAVTDPLNRTEGFGHGADFHDDLITRERRPEGNYVDYTYDGRGNRTSAKRVGKGGQLYPPVQWSYPTSCTNYLTCNQPEYMIDARGFQTDYTYDPTHGGVLTETLPAPTSGAPRPQRRYVYNQYYAWYKNASGTLVQAPSPVWLLSSISECRNSSSCTGSADETVTTFTYGTPGVANNLLLTSKTVRAGDNSVSATTSWTYNDWGDQITEDGPLPGSADTTRTRYDVMRRVIGVISPDPDGAGPLLHRAVRTTYDEAGRVKKVEIGTVNSQSDGDWSAFASLESTENIRDIVGRVVAAIKKSNGTTYAVTHTSYDGAWRPECAAIRMNPAQWNTLTHACSLQTAGPNGPDRIVKTIYNAAGEVTKVQRGVGTPDLIEEVRFSYTDNGKRQTLTDGENNTTTFTYDAFDRLYQTRFPVPAKGQQSSSGSDYEQLTYDANDNLTGRRLRDTQVISYSYDGLNRQTTKVLPSPEVTVGSTFDLQGRPLTVSQGGVTIGRAYDALGLMRSETTARGIMQYEFDAAGRRTKITWPDSFYVTQDYFVTGETWHIREYGATSGIGILGTYAYDNRGRRTSLSRGNGTVSNLGYDDSSRITSLSHNLAGTAADVSTTFTYNPASQLTSWTRANDAYAWASNPVTSRSYSVNGLNQLTQTVSSGSTVGYDYDDRGNLTDEGSTSYSYSVENRLLTSSSGAALSYDPIGRLSQTSSSAGTVRLQYDGADMVTEYNTSGTVLRRYVHGPGDDEPLVWYEGSGTADRRWLHQDERASVVAVSDGAGTMLNINTYDEFGIPALGNLGRFQYTGQTWLADLGVFYYKARIYLPTLGRFLQTDPVGYDDDSNLYAYVGNDPVNGADPSGLSSICVPNTGSRIESCVHVDGNGDGNTKDKDLTASQIQDLGRDYQSFIRANNGKDLSKNGLDVVNIGASQDSENLVRAVSQFIGTARGGWGGAGADWRLTVGTKEAIAAKGIPVHPAAGAWSFPVERTADRVRVGLSMYVTSESPRILQPSNLSRALIHESLHFYDSQTPLGRFWNHQLWGHSLMDRKARQLNVEYGFGNCEAMAGFPGC